MTNFNAQPVKEGVKAEHAAEMSTQAMMEQVNTMDAEDLDLDSDVRSLGEQIGRVQYGIQEIAKLLEQIK